MTSATTSPAHATRGWARLDAWVRRLTCGRPHLVFILLALLAFAGAYTLAFLLRFDFNPPEHYALYLRVTLPIAVLAKLIGFYALGVFRVAWAYVSIRDSLRILLATIYTSAAMVMANILMFPFMIVPRSIQLIDGVLTFLAMTGLFATLRLLHEYRREGAGERIERDPIFIVGAGNEGDMLLRELRGAPAAPWRAAAFLDDDPGRIGHLHGGLPVLGPIANAGRWAEQYNVKQALIAMPHARGEDLRRVIAALTRAQLAIRLLPPPSELSSAAGFLPQLREVRIEDLLRRAPIVLDTAGLTGFLRDQTVLVTGAAGSIGAELCRQIAEVQPARLIVLDIAESPLCDLVLDLSDRIDRARILPELVDITDAAAVARVFAAQRPQVVFHAAAVKHVPLLETQAERAARVNITGTRLIARAAALHCEAFVMISTDKAVNPQSVMGATKRLAEIDVRRLHGQGRTRFVSVRFGNVLGSSGSVIPIFKRQIARGGPVTVTHPEMQRFFMTIPEAVQLVLEAACLGRGGEIFVLDMGTPVRIVDLAEDLIRLSGLQPGEDVRIEFTGIRPGEKLAEELSTASEELRRTAHPQVFELQSHGDEGECERLLALLQRAGVSPSALRGAAAIEPSPCNDDTAGGRRSAPGKPR
ncbi:MAG: polysaccharide biosynthesis protein [Vicinamibacteria bacterium]|jgi:FlaA1/EpsC-like NDP-sugar epimerase|nr:polysaccharide biosynthesis protein [Vicinamibacteria bacterium]